MHRRTFLALSAGTPATGLSTKASAEAAAWPNRPVKVILPYAPGGATDAVGRPWAHKLGQAFWQPFVVENRGGAGRRGGAGVSEVGKAGLHGGRSWTVAMTRSPPPENTRSRAQRCSPTSRLSAPAPRAAAPGARIS